MLKVAIRIGQHATPTGSEPRRASDVPADGISNTGRACCSNGSLTEKGVEKRTVGDRIQVTAPLFLAAIFLALILSDRTPVNAAQKVGLNDCAPVPALPVRPRKAGPAASAAASGPPAKKHQTNSNQDTDAVATSDYPIQPVPFDSLQVGQGFWAHRFKTNRDVTIPYAFEKCEETGRIANFARAGGLEQGPHQGQRYDDSDVFKVIEGAAYALALQPDPKLDQYLDELIATIKAAQDSDGYLYTIRTLNAENDQTGKKRWSFLAHSHELYNVGHLYEAAVAHYRATGKRSLLDVALRNADLVCSIFGSEPGQRRKVPGHQEIEIGLIKLYRLTGKKKYLDTAHFFLEQRGKKSRPGQLYGEYSQDHQPVVEQQEAVGHAVRAGYMYSAMADIAALMNDEDYRQAIESIWRDITYRKLAVTGGMGAKRAGEGFGDSYELPNQTSYNETCAAVANAMFNHRMFLLNGDARYVDVLERIIYNGFLSGVSLSGNRFFYPNPLASSGDHARQEWFGTSCCPVNVTRFIPSVAGYVYGQTNDSIYVNLFVDGTGRIQLDGQPVKLTQSTRYPWEGEIRIQVDTQHPRTFALRIRVPGWSRGQPVPGNLYSFLDQSPTNWSIKVNGRQISPSLEKGFAVIDRKWNAGDAVEIDLPMPVQRVVANSKVTANRGRVALQRGPLVFCAEDVDNDVASIENLFLPDKADLKSDYRADLLEGVCVITGQAKKLQRTKEDKVAAKPIDFTAIPYFAWAHRGKSSMAVWLARNPNVAQPQPLPTLASQSNPAASHVFKNDTVEAINDLRVPSSSSDHSVPRFTWWPRRGATEWVQYNFPETVSISSAAVYWFDDTGVGQCRAPKSWHLLYRKGDKWHRIPNASSFGTNLDQFNQVTFPPISTDALRLKVKMQDDFSAGILEWRVE